MPVGACPCRDGGSTDHVADLIAMLWCVTAAPPLWSSPPLEWYVFALRSCG
jgi:hypothetical protein